jgi:hypothetical protein
MSMKIKTALVLLVTLVIGIILGALLDRAYIHNKFKKEFSSSRTREGFVERMEKIIVLTPEQRARVKPVLEKYGDRLMKFHDEFRGRMQELFKSFHDELEPLLTPEQMKNLETRFLSPRHLMNDGKKTERKSCD